MKKELLALRFGSPLWSKIHKNTIQEIIKNSIAKKHEHIYQKGAKGSQNPCQNASNISAKTGPGKYEGNPKKQHKKWFAGTLEYWLLPREYTCLHKIEISGKVQNNYQKTLKNTCKTITKSVKNRWQCQGRKSGPKNEGNHQKWSPIADQYHVKIHLKRETKNACQKWRPPGGGDLPWGEEFTTNPPAPVSCLYIRYIYNIYLYVILSDFIRFYIIYIFLYISLYVKESEPESEAEAESEAESEAKSESDFVTLTGRSRFRTRGIVARFWLELQSRGSHG